MMGKVQSRPFPRPSFLLVQLGTFALISNLLYCGEIYLFKWKVIYLKLKSGFNQTLSIYDLPPFSKAKKAGT